MVKSEIRKYYIQGNVAFQIRRNVVFLARIVHSQTVFGISINFTRRQSHEHK